MPKNLATIGKKRLETALQELFAITADRDVSMTDWAGGAGLSRNTVYRLAVRTTKYPRFQTLVSMAAALDVSIVMEPGK